MSKKDSKEFKQIHLRLLASDLEKLEEIAVVRGYVPIAALLREATKKFIKSECKEV